MYDNYMYMHSVQYIISNYNDKVTSILIFLQSSYLISSGDESVFDGASKQTIEEHVESLSLKVVQLENKYEYLVSKLDKIQNTINTLQPASTTDFEYSVASPSMTSNDDSGLRTPSPLPPPVYNLRNPSPLPPPVSVYKPPVFAEYQPTLKQPVIPSQYQPLPVVDSQLYQPNHYHQYNPNPTMYPYVAYPQITTPYKPQITTPYKPPSHNHPEPSSTTSSKQCSPSYLVTICAQSCSRGNFATNLMREWYSEEERFSSNVRGKNNKKKFSPKRLSQIRAAVFEMYPVRQKETEKEAWVECIKAIDGCNRSLRKRCNQ